MIIHKIAAGVAAFSAVHMLTSRKVGAWKSVTHEDIVRKALEILRSDGKTEAYNFFMQYENTLLLYCQKPDYAHDMDKGNGWHYYCIKNVDGKNIKSSENGYYKCGKNMFTIPRYSRTARTIFEDNYCSALTFFELGDTELSMQFLARSAHMLSDIGCTPHTTDLTLTSKHKNKHSNFETFINTVYDMFDAGNCHTELYDEYIKDRSFGTQINKLARVSASFYDMVVNSASEKDMRFTASKALCLTQQNVAALLNRFYEDAQASHDVVENGSEIYLKNAKTGRYIGVVTSQMTNKAVIAQVGKKCPKNKFIVRINDNGTYSFISKETGRRLCAVPLSLLALTDNSETLGTMFKLGKTPDGYRISTAVSKYVKAVTARKESSCIAENFNPDDKAQLWVIEK